VRFSCSSNHFLFSADPFAQPAEWVSIFPSVGNAAGGYLITINGAGFDNTAVTQYQCQIRSCMDTNSIATMAQTANVTTIVCPVPTLLEGCLSPFLVLKGASLLKGSGLFSFTPIWTSMSQSYGPVGGGTRLRIGGAGFNVSQVYRCKFMDVISSITLLSESAVTDSRSSFSCIVPTWVSLNRISRLFVVQSQTGDIVPRISSLSDSIFEFTNPRWFSTSPQLSYVQPQGSYITVYGQDFALVSSNPTFTIGFVGATHSVQTNSCTLINNSQFMCRIPSWPDVEQEVKLNIWGDNSPLPQSGSNQTFKFKPVWSGIARSSTAGSVTGGYNISVFGAGFLSSAQSYRCRWFSLVTNSFVESVVFARNQTLIYCLSPIWLINANFAVEQVVKLILYDVGLGTLPQTGGDWQSRFEIVAY
jgi:hypothetical protein